MTSTRLYQFDTLKGIGIILVMLGHALPSYGFFHNMIYGFHMPLFFFCSGFFFKDKLLMDGIYKDTKGLLIPWSFFSLLLLLCSIVLHRFASAPSPQFAPFDENCYILYYTIWFLICMFIVRQLYQVIVKNCNRLAISILIWSGYLLAFILRQLDINIPFFIDSAMAMLLFFHIGKVFHDNELYLKKYPFWLNISLIMLYIIFIWHVAPIVNIKNNQYPIYLFFLSIVPIWALYQISLYLHSSFLIRCGMASLAIMGLHHPIYDVCMFPIMNRLNFPVCIESLLMVTITLSIILPLEKIISKFTPFILGKF